MSRSTQKPDLYQERNAKIVRFFADCSLTVKLIGAKNSPSPAVIFNNNLVLCCYINKNSIQFKNKKTLKLKCSQEHIVDDELKAKIMHWFETGNHRRCYNIKLKGTPLYLSGYGSRSKEDDTLFPVFCEINRKIYFREEYAQSIIELYSSKDLKLIIE